MTPIVWVIAAATSLQCVPNVGYPICFRGVNDPKTGQMATYYLEYACVTDLPRVCPQGGQKTLVCRCMPMSELGK